MKLPPQLTLKNTGHGHGAKGLAFYTYEDAEGLGVICDARRERYGAPFVETWRFRWMPGITFPDLARVVEALRVLPDEAVAAEKAKWPVLVNVAERRAGDVSSCWMHRDRPATHTAYAQTCWIEGAGQIALLCAECAAEAETDAGVILRAGEARRAYVTESRA